MPRLSIIVPHCNDDARLELTLLSVLENRPQECEVLVVHNGSYPNPYQLQDEVIFVQEERQANTQQLLNAGVLAACAPVVCVLMDGSLVSAGWSEAALQTLQESDCAAVAVGIANPHTTQAAWGISGEQLGSPQLAQVGRVEGTSSESDCLGPSLACGFYRRKLLLALGGWNDALDASLADVELALNWSALGLRCETAGGEQIAVAHSQQTRQLTPAACCQLASLLVAHGRQATGWPAALHSLLGGCLRGRWLAAAAWSRGLRDASAIRKAQLRLNHVRQQLDSQQETGRLRIHERPATPATGRRAA